MSYGSMLWCCDVCCTYGNIVPLIDIRSHISCGGYKIHYSQITNVNCQRWTRRLLCHELNFLLFSHAVFLQFRTSCRDQYISKFPFIRCGCQPPKCDKDAMLTTAHSSSSDSKRNLYLFGCHPCRFVIFLPAILKPNACVNGRRDEFSNFMNINA